MELGFQVIPFEDQVEWTWNDKGRPLKQSYNPDFIGFDKIIQEIKAVSTLADEHRTQVHNYLKATGIKRGLLVNFGHHPKVPWERIVR